MRAMLDADAWLRARLDEPWGYFEAPAIVEASERGDGAMVAVLAAAGADVNARSGWNLGGSGVLHGDKIELWVCGRRADGAPITTDLFADLRRRGLRVDAHAAANLGDADTLLRRLDARPDLANARGRDGATPLHLARTPPVVDLLLERGADPEIRDLDHGATPAQWAIDTPAVCRRLIERGAAPDIFIACALGDLGLAERVLAEHPAALGSRSNHGPHLAARPPGGHVYVYRMGVGMRPLPFASSRGHHEFARRLRERAAPSERLIHAAWIGDRAAAAALVEQHPNLAAALGPDDARALCDAAWLGNLDGAALMLEIGFPVDARGDDDATPLDRAAVRGYADLAALLLEYDPPLEAVNAFGGAPLSAAVWGAHSFRDPKGDYVRTVELLAAAGCEPNRRDADGHTQVDRALAGGREDVAQALRRYGGRAAAELDRGGAAP